MISSSSRPIAGFDLIDVNQEVRPRFLEYYKISKCIESEVAPIEN